MSWAGLQVLLYAQQMVGPFPGLDPFVYQGMIVGLGVGIFIYSRDMILSENFMALKTSILIGACVGLGSGFLGFAMGQSLLAFPVYIELSWVRLVSWALLGFWLGILVNLTVPASRRRFSQVMGALLGGLLGGVFFEAYPLLEIETMSNLVRLTCIGMILSLSIVFFQISTAKAYLRVLTGESEGKIYLLDKKKCSLGYQSQNDIVLRGYSEVCETHAHIIKNSPNYQIINVCPGGQIFINYRFVDQQSMKNGDIIKLGTALLQYCEVL